MADNARLLLVALVSSIALVAAYLVTGGLFPSAVERTRRAVDDTPASAFWLGLVNIIFLSLVGFGLAGLAQGTGIGLLQLPALAFFGLLLAMLLFGLTAMADLLGQRMLPDRARFTQRWRAGAIMTLACLTPVIGWFGIFIYVACAGVGGFVLGWSRRPRTGSGGDPAD